MQTVTYLKDAKEQNSQVKDVFFPQVRQGSWGVGPVEFLYAGNNLNDMIS
jgi:hypothetical protein